MKLLLTSDGFENPNIVKEFLKLLDKPEQENKVVFLYTKSDFNEKYLELINVQWGELGFNKENLKFINIGGDVGEVSEFDIIFVCGGNTFYILDRIRKTGFDEVIKKSVREGKIYIGVSAGSILMGPDIEICGRGDDWDVNEIGLKDLTGLGFTDKILSPHYIDEEKEIIVKFEKESCNKVTLLRDGEALLIDGNEERLIG